MSFLLLETGDHMLQETADDLLLDEVTTAPIPVVKLLVFLSPCQ